MPNDHRTSRLTPRDYDIINLAARGLTDQQIGQELGLSRGTVIGYWSRIRLKLQVSSRTEAVSFMKSLALKAAEEAEQALHEKLTRTEQETTTLKRHSSELEDLVRRRTAELEEANQGLRQEIAKRAAIESELRKSEEKFRLMYENAEVALYKSDIEGRTLIEANAKALELFGGTRKSLIGKPTVSLWTDQNQRAEVVGKLLEEGRIEHYPCCFKGRNALVKHCSVNGVLDRQSGTIEWAAIDVTNAYRAQRALDKNNERARLLLELHQKSPHLSDDQLYRMMLDIAVSLTDSKVGFFHLVSSDQNSIQLTVWNEETRKNCSAPHDIHYPISEAGNWVDCIRQKKAVVYNDYASSPNQRGLPEGHQAITRFMSVPVIHDGLVTAVFGVGNKALPYDDNDVHQIEMLAQDVQILIDNRKLHADLVQSESEVRRKLDALISPGNELAGISLTDLMDMAEVEKLFKMLRRLTGLTAGIIGPDGQGYAGSGWQEVCESFHRAAGRSCARCLESDRLMTSDIKPGSYKLYKCHNNLWEMATPVVVADKTLGTLVIGQFFFDDERVDYESFERQAEEFGYDKAAYLASLEKVPRVSRDYLQGAITLFSSILNQLIRQCYSKLQVAKALHERQVLLDAVSLAEEKFRVAFETSPDSVTLHRLSDGTYLEANEGVCKISGYSKDELIGKTWFDIDLWADPGDSQRFMGELSEHGKVVNFRARLKRKDGGIIHKLISASKLTVNGEPCLLVVGLDVTGLVAAEEDLRRSRENLREAVRIAKLARWEYDVHADSFKTSDTIFDFIAVEPVTERISAEDVLKRFGEADRLELEAQIARLQSHNTPISLEAQVTLDDGSKRWLSILGEARRDAEGKLAKIVGTLQDVTERKELEQEIHESNERFRAIAESMPDNFFEQDLDLRYTHMVNPVFGYKVSDIIGKTDFDLLPEEQARELTAFKRRVMETGEPMPCATSLEREGYERAFFEGTFVPKFDKAGKVCGLLGYFRNVTKTQKLLDELEQANQRLVASQRQMEDIIEGMPDAIFRFDAKRRIVYASEQAAQVTDRPIHELAYATVSDLGLPTEASAKIDSAIRQVIRRGVMQEVEVVGGKPGAQRHFNWRLVPEPDREGKVVSVLAVVRDMTEHRKAVHDFSMLFEQMLDGFALHEIILDAEGRPCNYRFLAVNPAFERLTGLRASEIIGKTVLEVLPYTEPLWIDTYGKVALSGEPAHFESYSKALDKHFEVAVFQPAPLQFACIVRDITERIQISKSLRNYHEQLENNVELRTRELAEAVSELESFSYSVSHDLRAPLRALNGLTRILKEDYSGKFDEDGEYLLDRIAHSAEHMAHLIDGLLRLSRINRASLELTRVCLSDLCFNYIESEVDELVAARVEWKIEPGVFAECDGQLAESLMDNLLGNAVKYSSKVDKPVVQFGTCEIEGEQVFFVRDNGVGFDMAFSDKLFNPFQRLHHQDEYTGLGVGLATAKRVVNRHGGRIWAESSPGCGSTFYFTLAPKKAEPQASKMNGQNKNGRGDTI